MKITEKEAKFIAAAAIYMSTKLESGTLKEREDLCKKLTDATLVFFQTKLTQEIFDSIVVPDLGVEFHHGC